MSPMLFWLKFLYDSFFEQYAFLCGMFLINELFLKLSIQSICESGFLHKLSPFTSAKNKRSTSIFWFNFDLLILSGSGGEL